MNGRYCFFSCFFSACGCLLLLWLARLWNVFSDRFEAFRGGLRSGWLLIFFCGSVSFWWRRISGHFWKLSLRCQRPELRQFSPPELFPTLSLFFTDKFQRFSPPAKLYGFCSCWELCGCSIAACEAAHRGFFLRKANRYPWFENHLPGNNISLSYNKACNSNSANMGFATGFVSLSLSLSLLCSLGIHSFTLNSTMQRLTDFYLDRWRDAHPFSHIPLRPRAPAQSRSPKQIHSHPDAHDPASPRSDPATASPHQIRSRRRAARSRRRGRQEPMELGG